MSPLDHYDPSDLPSSAMKTPHQSRPIEPSQAPNHQSKPRPSMRLQPRHHHHHLLVKKAGSEGFFTSRSGPPNRAKPNRAKEANHE
ncbi:hypothetical protein PGT21_007946 [Puccinia graminis f. sp. tritici]|uniref:Uncharacterized protein n=1 Tax=Puccinia graminis f. sp. tritici TaxID=56615 RepID=A0A5B0N834_PUCGR|nr:hypothetical protein PGTUg99_006916 [Puccinia graminis f. sp. tritici]KAA1085461.1 hypothetical protein PGT21_007946 [Puccinia graminis f. sp. tritici]KAA1122961.1 hypothetical protein PGTUg99_008758 [Puccinia graminis f. sp. tritici]